MNDERRAADARESREQIVVTETFPYRLLHASHDTEGSQIARALWVSEVAVREWSASDMKKLRQFAKSKVSARVAAQKLGRSPGAVRYKAMMEGVSFRSINRRK